MVNWNNRRLVYYNELVDLANQGWLTRSQADVAYGSFTNDQQYLQLLQIGRSRKEAAMMRAKEEAGLKRTGGLTRPGNVITSPYYERYLGLSKDQIDAFRRVPVWTEDRYWKNGRMIEKWHENVPDVEYVIRQRWEAQYDPGYSNTQLKGNRKWELQSATVDKYVGAIKDYYKGAEAEQKKSTQSDTAYRALEVLRHTPTRQTTIKKAGKEKFGASILSMPTLSQTGVGKNTIGQTSQNRILNMTGKIDRMLGVPSVQMKVTKARPVAGTLQQKQVKSGKAKSASTLRQVTKAKPKPGIRIKW